MNPVFRALRKLREDWGLTQPEAAKGAGIGTPTLAHWETSEDRAPNWPEIRAYLAFWGIDLETLVVSAVDQAQPLYGAHRKLNGQVLTNAEVIRVLNMYDQSVDLDYIAEKFLVSPYVIRVIARTRDLQKVKR